MPEATVQVDSNSPTPVYRQIVDQFRVHLNSGALAPGDRLPSVRSLAAQLGVHFNTIAEAYRELAHEGWIDLGSRKRAVVIAQDTPRPLPALESDVLRRSLQRLLAEMLLKGVAATTIHSDIVACLGEETCSHR